MKKQMLVIFGVLFVVASILDIKYKGKFYQLLPETVQRYLSGWLR